MQARGRVLIVGAGPTARILGQILARTHDISFVDSSREQCAFAETSGLHVVCGSALDHRVLEAAGAAHARLFIALTPNAEVNALAAQTARTVFDVPEIHLPCGRDRDGHAALIGHLGATTLFGDAVTLTDWDYWIEHDRVDRLGLPLKRRISPRTLFKELQSQRPSLLLALRRDDVYLPFHSGLQLCEHDRVILLRNEAASPLYFDRFDRLAARCPVLDLDRRMSAEGFFELAAAALAPQIGLSREALTERFLDREATSSTVIAPGLAIPHVLIDGTGHFHLLIARCREGIPFPGQREEVHALFVLVRSSDERNFHLRALAAVAQIVQDPGFETKWLTAGGPEALRQIVLDAERRRYPEAVTGALP